MMLDTVASVVLRHLEKAHAQIVLSAQHHHQHLATEDVVEELNLRNTALSSSATEALHPTVVAPSTLLPAKRHLLVDKAKANKQQAAGGKDLVCAPSSLLGSFGAQAEGLMVAAPARTLHEALGEIVTGEGGRRGALTLLCTPLSQLACICTS
ncbi:hypothetical protein HPB48_003823 [Haemaphysalis longicornis]|uniref:Uncharacterized protein n=1 Tax=Haemaphysalis longicornis TaxID=44386 RepID=A0A9J6FBJ3_HAELO|nr:hypothetical protein HPB48_003823 [Haemaphysalis longicornis]